MRRSNGYHTRLRSNNTVKVVGGIFGGSLDLETANRLVNAHFTVKVLPSGFPTFVDKEGREVSLYMSVHPEATDKGKLALDVWRREQAAKERESEKREAEERSLVEDLMENLTHEEIVRRLKGKSP